MKRGVRDFFKYARKRHQITIDRAAGVPRERWTKDPILQTYRFTCVFRELDKTTVWFRENVRDKYRDSHMVLLATVVFRLLNRVETGEAVFRDDDLLGGFSAFDKFAEKGDVRHLKRAIIKRLGTKGPFVTGAYIISSPTGYTKLDGVLEVIRRFYTQQRTMHGLGAGVLDTMLWHDPDDGGAAEVMLCSPGNISLEMVWGWLRQFDYFGNFHAYEMVTDLRHTRLLDRAPDILSWASPGPGARRGANRVMGRVYNDKTTSREGLIQEMRDLLRLSQEDATLWPSEWPVLEMREIEHTLCEFDKYERVRTGLGKPRGVYR